MVIVYISPLVFRLGGPQCHHLGQAYRHDEARDVLEGGRKLRVGPQQVRRQGAGGGALEKRPERLRVSTG